MTPTRAQVPDSTDVRAALAHVCGGVARAAGELARFERVAPAALPEPFGFLLRHDEHMTLRLASFHGEPVALEVLAVREHDEWYAREILLTLSDSGRVVEYGIARINLRRMSPEVGDEIRARRRPLGEILVGHDVLRRIDPKWFVRVPADTSVGALFDGALGAWAFGRVGTIFCDEEPAIELLELVSGWRPGQVEPRP